MNNLLRSFPEIPLATGQGFDFVNVGLRDDARVEVLEEDSAEMQAVPVGQSMEVEVDRESEAA